MANEVRIGVSVADHASGPIDKIRDSFANFGSQAKKGLMEGIGIGAGLEAVNLVKKGVEEFKDLLQDSAQAAIRDEQSQSRLAASLKANVPAWDDNTRAIEASLEAGQKKGFTDAEQRDSLGLLVAATHDVNKALDVQNVAMDLARFKHIDLQTASEALTKVEAGRFRILASLGIQLKDGATATDALAAVEAVAAGQADAFGNTTEGAMKRAQVAIEEAQVSFGELLLPAIKEAASFIADVAIPAIRSLGGVLANASHAAEDFARPFENLASPLGRLGDMARGGSRDFDALGAAADWTGRAFRQVSDTPAAGALAVIGREAGNAAGALGAVVGPLVDIGQHAPDAVAAVDGLSAGLRDMDKIDVPEVIPSLSEGFRDMDKIGEDALAGLAQGFRDMDKSVGSPGNTVIDLLGSEKMAHAAKGIDETGAAALRMVGNFKATWQGISTLEIGANIAKGLEPVPNIVHTWLTEPFSHAQTRVLLAVSETFSGIAERIKTGRESIAKAISGTVSDVFDPQINRAQRAADVAALADPQLQKDLGSKDAKTVAAARLQILSLQKDIADLDAEYTRFGSSAQRKTALFAEASSRELVKGLHSSDAAVKAGAKAASALIDAELHKLQGDAYDYGKKTGNAYIDGLNAAILRNANLVTSAMGEIRGVFETHSPPGPKSPLHGIDLWGKNAAASWVDAFIAELGRSHGGAGDALRRLGGSLSGGGRVGSHGMSGGHGGNTYVFNLGGHEIARIVGEATFINQRLLGGATRPGSYQ